MEKITQIEIKDKCDLCGKETDLIIDMADRADRSKVYFVCLECADDPANDWLVDLKVEAETRMRDSFPSPKGDVWG